MVVKKDLNASNPHLSNPRYQWPLSFWVCLSWCAEKNGPSGISVGNGGEKQPPLREQHDILNEFVGAPGSDRPPHMELPTENPDGPKKPIKAV